MTRQPSYKNFIKRLLSSKVFFFFMVIALVALLLNFVRESYHKYQLSEEISGLETEVERLEGRKQQLAGLMEYFGQESYLEKEARQRLNLKKPGERVIILSQKADADVKSDQGIDNILDDNTALGQNTENQEMANYWKWWEYFFTP